MLEVVDLACSRGDKQLFTGLSLQVKPGQLVFVHGRNGSGKTTLLRTVCGLFLPDEGEIRWDGKKVSTLSEEFRARMTYLGHLNGLKDELTGLENLQISSRLAGQNVSEAEISDVLARLGVEECQDLPTKVLSQGQKKRMALARFWLHRAALWVLDEPFTALDVHGVDILLSQISDHVAAGGMVVLTSHQDVELGAGEIRHIHLS